MVHRACTLFRHAGAPALTSCQSIKSEPYYRRTGDSDNAYVIACLVARFARPNPVPDYMQSALYALTDSPSCWKK